MRGERRRNPLLRMLALIPALLLAAAALGIGMFYYVFGIAEPEGLSLASWPQRFTDNFSAWMEDGSGRLEIEETGLERLDEYGLWLQVIDGEGREVFAHRKPDGYPEKYSAAELLALAGSPYGNGYTVFAGEFAGAGGTWSYIVGFPYAIGKRMLYYNGENVARLSPLFRVGIRCALCAVILFVLAYGLWLARHLGKITRGIGQVALRSYAPLPERGVFRQIYAALNRMDAEIRRSDAARRDASRARREWIVNLTHDLKTPLSPIKGYAELLMGSPGPDSASARKYGEIILRNVNHAEELVNDLKLADQLESGAAPCRPQRTRLARFLKELVIDIVNDPAFAGRNIAFLSGVGDAEVSIDPALFRRAVNNLVINALTHNPPETAVTIEAASGADGTIEISVSDDGDGMSAEEQAELFNRYYRGTSTREKPEGSGLGLAIARQILRLHGGDVAVESARGAGTRFTISLPPERR